MNAAVRAKTKQPQSTGPDNSRSTLDPATERSLVAYATLNKYLQCFIDHVS